LNRKLELKENPTLSLDHIEETEAVLECEEDKDPVVILESGQMWRAVKSQNDNGFEGIFNDGAKNWDTEEDPILVTFGRKLESSKILVVFRIEGSDRCPFGEESERAWAQVGKGKDVCEVNETLVFRGVATEEVDPTVNEVSGLTRDPARRVFESETGSMWHCCHEEVEKSVNDGNEEDGPVMDCVDKEGKTVQSETWKRLICIYIMANGS
jgi:hypothetical protein